jgi:hypothetical protein
VHEMLTFRGVSPTNTHARGEEVHTVERSDRRPSVGRFVRGR